MSKVSEIFIGVGAALSANNTALPSIAVQTGVVGSDMLTLDPAGSDTITTQPTIYLVNKLANGDFKRSNPIKGLDVTGFKAEHYVPARRNVWGIGYQRGSIVDGVTTAASGSITVNNSTLYEFIIRFKNDKQFYSERPEVLDITFTSSAVATQLTIATQIANTINNSAFGTSTPGVREIVAVVVGDGTGIHGLTAATNYGVEITGLVINQFQNTTYQEELVYFSVFTNDATGFQTTPATEIQSFKAGTGTYNQVYNMENFFFGYEGVLNRRLWPVPVLAYLTSATYTVSGNVAAAATTPTGNITTVIGEDKAVVATATTGLRPGEQILINSVAYEIKYILDATHFIVTVPFVASYGAGANLQVKYLYDIININVTDLTYQDGTGVGQLSKKNFYIAAPAIDTNAADPFDRTLDSADTSAEMLSWISILDAWMVTTPGRFAAITLA